jgi:hypothetical protein
MTSQPFTTCVGDSSARGHPLQDLAYQVEQKRSAPLAVVAGRLVAEGERGHVVRPRVYLSAAPFAAGHARGIGRWPAALDR